MTTLFWSERTSKPERQYIGHSHINPNAIRAGRRGTNAIEMLKKVSHAHSLNRQKMEALTSQCSFLSGWPL